ncbi:small ribosomal subunit protein mS23 isoform 2-T2 [Odontesthes bonariensis]|uniref:small ribosomal subunit protein mS23 isoform X2 n=1 Tax=Odontesthes bonariensis TaxID=219752 RepID=UPI003F581E61
MAGSRLERFGTVFSRVRDLMRTRVIKPHEKPIWYDVYMAFPPKRDPLYVKRHTRACTNEQETVPEIFYAEDEVRAFIVKYAELQSQSELTDSALFEETAKALLKEGIILRRRGLLPVEESRDPVFDLKLKDMLAEQHSVDTQTAQT